jgi:hypothetical protein
VTAAETSSQAQSPEEYRRQAVEMLNKALNASTQEIGSETDRIERGVVELRDALIGQSRQVAEPGEVARVRLALRKVNAALSLIVGVEYPVKGHHRELLEQARTLLLDLDREDVAGDGEKKP